jgi:Tfp pilus assembly protein PilN
MQADFLDLNLLPRDRQPTSIGSPGRSRVPEILGLALIFVAVLMLVPLSAIKMRNDRQLARTIAAVDLSRQQVRDADRILARESQLRQQTQSLLIQADALEQQLRRLEAQGDPISSLLQPMTQLLPPRVTITSLVQVSETTIRVTGEGGSTSLVLEFAQSLERLGGIRSVSIVGVDRLMEESAPPTAVRYTLELER